MSYIGRPLQVANLAVMSGVGDGSDTTPIATLDYATVTNGIAVYLDGVRQLAGTDFNVTAQTTLTFTTAPANGVGVDVYFLGLELSLPTPADATVTTAKIAANAVDETKLKDALVADFTEVVVAAGDSFLLGDSSDSGNTKRDTIQGLLDLVPAGGLTIASKQATASGSSVTFGSIPSGVKFIQLLFDECSIDGASNLAVTLGDSGGLETSGYIGTGMQFKNGTANHGNNATNRFIIANNTASHKYSGIYTLTLYEASTYTWAMSHAMTAVAGNLIMGAGRKALSGELTQISLAPDAGSFDAGAVNISYF